MIGKLITYGATRSEALKKMNRALEEYVIMGINTNIQLHQKIIQTDEFKRGSYNICLLYTSPSPRDGLLSRMPSSA